MWPRYKNPSLLKRCAGKLIFIHCPTSDSHILPSTDPGSKTGSCRQTLKLFTVFYLTKRQVSNIMDSKISQKHRWEKILFFLQVTCLYFSLRCGTWPNHILTSISQSTSQSPVPSLPLPSLWSLHNHLGNVFVMSESMSNFCIFCKTSFIMTMIEY